MHNTQPFPRAAFSSKFSIFHLCGLFLAFLSFPLFSLHEMLFSALFPVSLLHFSGHWHCFIPVPKTTQNQSMTPNITAKPVLRDATQRINHQFDCFKGTSSLRKPLYLFRTKSLLFITGTKHPHQLPLLGFGNSARRQGKEKDPKSDGSRQQEQDFHLQGTAPNPGHGEWDLSQSSSSVAHVKGIRKPSQPFL